MFKFDLSKIIGTNSLRSSIKQVESIQICLIFNYIVDEENCMLALTGCKYGYDEFYIFICVALLILLGWTFCKQFIQ